MAIVNVNGISGINSITAQSGSLNFYTAAGNNLPISAGTLNVGTGASVSSPATNVLTLGTNNSERVRIGSTGSVGIGTNESYGDSNASFTSLSLGGNGTRYGLIELNRSDGTAGSWIDCYGTGGNGDLRVTTAGTSGAITFWTGGAFTEKVRIDSSGNLGIGTTNSSSKLQVQGTIGLGASDDLESGFSGGRTKLTSSASGFVINHNDNSATIFQNQGTERVRIDSSGRVTTPYQVAFHVPKITGDTLTTTPTKITLGSATYDVGSNYSDANDRFTAPVAGKYFFYVSVNVLNTGNNVYISIRKNGGLYGQILYAATNFPRMDFNPVGIIDLAAGDYVEIYGVVNTGTVTVDNAGYFGGYLLG